MELPVDKPSYPIHPLCHLFPALPDEELYGLAEDIRRRGLLESIMLLDGQVLDGRNRLIACGIAGVKPHFVEWEGDDSPLEWSSPRTCAAGSSTRASGP
jgi:hypothetical protein